MAESNHGLAIPLEEALQYILKMSNHDLIKISTDCEDEDGWESNAFLQNVMPWKVKVSRKVKCFAKNFSHLYVALKRIKHIAKRM